MIKKLRVMWPLLFLIIICGAVLLRLNYIYNSEEHTASLLNGAWSDDEVEIKLCARGQGTDEVATWEYGGFALDENGEQVSASYIGTIYELTVTNKSGNSISDWKFSLTMPEDTYFNSGWNGEFGIHQYTSSEAPGEFATSNFDMTDSPLEYTNFQSCLLVPLEKGDWFTYSPSMNADEYPIRASYDPDEYSSKTIGFILYFRDKDISYIADFTDCTVTYHMYRNILDNTSFRAVCLAFAIWVLGVFEVHVLYLHTKKLVARQKRSMKIINESMETFANFIDAKDPNTSGHSLRVAQYSRLIAEKMDMSEEECQDIYYIGLLHDCGKISIPQEILMKPGRLDDDEYEVMKSHSQKGYEMLANFTSIPNIGEGAFSHHERYDGRGYPRGLSGTEIPLIGRIICVADAFDAMNSKRCYRDKLDREVILDELKKNSGSQFDPDIIKLFLELVEEDKVKM